MSDHPKRTDLESQIDVLIKRAEDTLRHQLNDLRRGHAAEIRQDQTPQRPPSDPASGDAHDATSPWERQRLKSPVVKRSICIAGHKTSISLEDAFWKELREIAAERHMKLSELAHTISVEREKGNLSSAIRLFVLEFYRKQIVAQQDKQDGHRAA
jgi:predicted DNA-binding ribbon-helix-helix protein